MNFSRFLLFFVIAFAGAACENAYNNQSCNQMDTYSFNTKVDIFVSIDQLKITPECYVNEQVIVQGILRGDNSRFYLFDQETSVKYYDPSKVVELDLKDSSFEFSAADISEEKFIWVRVSGEYAAPDFMSHIRSIEVLDSRYY